MLSLTKEFSWDMAHMLAHHEGLCKNLHGHTYKMEVKVGRDKGSLAQTGPDAGMVIDFKGLKRIVKKEVVDPLDHGFIYWANSPDRVEIEVAKVLKQAGRKVVKLNYRPTAEMMALDFFKRLEDKFIGEGIKLLEIKLWETPTSYAQVRGDE
ncbi:6-pyruvoyl trahydropterin synthase family protein [Halonatronum saccharophilum]|uniref:6-pyruvoyl trahydropterin synthase family protein n=1 Tax=Halonatronum saccharophilum TaxID=150060 RepID=UPI000488C435|nr:6-carboxytetrahydropterin synthase [Halonatronum saccharophilum]